MSNLTRIVWYAATVFFSSALLLVLEIVAGRLIAPYVGVSLYTWTSIIGVILAGLSLGNWLGGVWADRGAGESASGIVLALAGVSCMAVLLLLTLIAPLIQNSELSLLSASFFYVLSLFFVPSVLLGVITPLLTTLALSLDTRTGHIVGLMNALAALGSIFGTFITGYWLVQYIGTRMIIIACTAGLFLLAMPFLLRTPRKTTALLIIAVIAVTTLGYIRQGFSNPCDKESQYFCIRVVDASMDVPFGEARAMVLDHLVHGINHATIPEMLVSPYAQAMDELINEQFGESAQHARFFFAGGGSYTQPRAFKTLFPQAEFTVAEIDPQVTRTANESLFVNLSGMRIMHMDARMALQSLDGERFDVIIGDVFHDISIPYHLITREYLQLLKSRLSDNGAYLMNVIDIYPDPYLIKSLYKTLKAEFKHVHIWLDELPDEPLRITYVISASNKHEPPELLVAKRGFQRSWRRITDDIMQNGKSLNELPLLTDNFVPVDRLVSRILFTEIGL